MYYLEKIKDFILRKKYLLLTIVVVIIILIIISALIFRKKDDRIEEIIPIEKEKIVEETKECKVKVDIKGYINKPDLYEVDCNARVEDVIKLANGLKEEADTSVINLSKKVFDEMVIYIYSTNEVKNFVEVKKEEKIKEEKCVTQAPIKNDACVCPNNKLETTVTIINEDTNQNLIHSVTIKKFSNGAIYRLPLYCYKKENNYFVSCLADVKNSESDIYFVTGIEYGIEFINLNRPLIFYIRKSNKNQKGKYSC